MNSQSLSRGLAIFEDNSVSSVCRLMDTQIRTISCRTHREGFFIALV